MKKITRRDFLKGALAGTATVAASGLMGSVGLADDAAVYTPGTYTAQAQGIGNVTVTMTFDETSITDVILDVSEETPSIGQAAAEDLKAALMAAQSGEFEAISGATVTSTAVQKAAANCIAQAKGEIEVQVITEKEEEEDGDWLGTEPEIDEADITQTIETDILVIGCGTGGMFTMASAAEEGAKIIGIDRFPPAWASVTTWARSIPVTRRNGARRSTSWSM